MKKIFVLLLLLAVSFSCYSIDKKELLTNITNQITVVKSEIKNLDVKIKLDKTNATLVNQRETFNVKLKTLENNKKTVEKAIKKEKETADALKKYQKLQCEYVDLEHQVEKIFYGF